MGMNGNGSPATNKLLTVRRSANHGQFICLLQVIHFHSCPWGRARTVCLEDESVSLRNKLQIDVGASWDPEMEMDHSQQTNFWPWDVKQTTVTGTNGNGLPTTNKLPPHSHSLANIVKILNLYIMLSCTHLLYFFPVSIHSRNVCHCLLHLYVEIQRQNLLSYLLSMFYS